MISTNNMHFNYIDPVMNALRNPGQAYQNASTHLIGLISRALTQPESPKDKISAIVQDMREVVRESNTTSIVHDMRMALLRSTTAIQSHTENDTERGQTVGLNQPPTQELRQSSPASLPPHTSSSPLKPAGKKSANKIPAKPMSCVAIGPLTEKNLLSDPSRSSTKQKSPATREHSVGYRILRGMLALITLGISELLFAIGKNIKRKI